MKKLLLGFGAMALAASAAFAQEPTVSDSSRMAAADSAAFTKLDSDADGRVSAIEAANDSKVAAGFTQADADKDGYLSKAEFANLGKASKQSMDESDSTAMPRSDSSIPDSSTPPQQ
jgi:Ca2+-binding EF-hand superfamily protein